MAINLGMRIRSLFRRWRDDTRGTSMVTTAMTLPVLIVILFGIWYLFWWLMVKQQLHFGVMEAARQATEQGRYWNIDPTNTADIDRPLMPADFYEIEARRVIETRLRDISNFSSPTLKNALVVRVEEPILAYAPGSTQAPIPEGFIDRLCEPKAFEPGEYRAAENIRLRIYAELNLPFFPVRIPYMDTITVTLKDRAIGYVQCPRWRGQSDGTTKDQSEKLGQEAPFMQYRFPSTPSYPSVTPPPTDTATPPLPTNTPTGP
jgi:hypothetical protein